ncbi:MAG: c-type cytochrome domain-containing protein, partial [Planctomycetaceae bacterium]
MENRRRRCGLLVLLWATVSAGWLPQACAQRAPSASGGSVGERDPQVSLAEFVGKYCAACHSQPEPKAGLTLDTLTAHSVPQRADVWERVVRKLRSRQMPPRGAVRPSADAYRTILARLTADLDLAAAAEPHPGRAASL